MIDFPIYYMPMPVNADGNGPADESEAMRILHEVWDADCATICTAPTEELARLIVALLNAQAA